MIRLSTLVQKTGLPTILWVETCSEWWSRQVLDNEQQRLARGGDPGEAVDAGLRQLGTFSVDGAFARWNGGSEMSMANFDQLWTRLEERLPGTASGGVVDGYDDDLAPNEPGWLHAIWSF